MPSELADALARSRRWLALLATAAVAALVCLGLGAWVVSGPSHATTRHRLPYTSTFTLHYRATPRTGTAYGTAVVRTGEPLFVQALQDLELRVRYSLGASGLGPVHGTLAVHAYLADQGLDVPVGPAVVAPLNGSASSTATIALPIARYRAAVASLEHLSGATTFPLEVAASAHAQGTLAGHPFVATPSAHFAFQATPWEVVLATTARSTPGAPTVDAAAPAPTHTVAGSLHWSTTLDRRVGLGPVQVPRRSAGLSLVGVGLASCALALVVRRRLSRLLASDERVGALLRLGTRASGVVGFGDDSLAGRHVVRLAGAGDLLRVAKTLESPVLHASDSAALHLQVRDGRDVYLVEVPANERARQEPPLSALDGPLAVDAPTAPRSTPPRWRAGTPPVGNGRRA